MLRTNYYAFPTLVTLLFHVSVSHAIETPADLLSLVPSCAQECAASFIRINYGFSDNAKPSLEALCTRTGATDFTIGEALMQCLNAELEVKFCSHQDVTSKLIKLWFLWHRQSNSNTTDQVLYKAYHICDDVSSAIKPTHTVITATLAVAPSGGVMTFPAVSSRTTSKISSEHLITESRHLSRPTSTSSSTSSTSTQQTSSSTTATEASSTPTSTSTGTPLKLSKGQIVGISVAGVFGGACVIGLIVLLVYYCYQRRKAKRGSHVPSRDSWGYKFEREPQNEKNSWETSHSEDAARVTTQTYNRGSWRPSAIGYAVCKTPLDANAGIPPLPITPRDGSLTPKRPLSKLLPERPEIAPSHTAPSAVAYHAQSFPAAHHQPSQSQTNKTSPPVQPSIRAVPPSFTITAPSTSSFNGPDSTHHSVTHAERAPALPKLVIPKTRNVMPPEEARESNITEFEDDNPSSAQNSANNQQHKNGPYQNGQNYYIADGQGNWTRADTQAHHSVVELSSQATPDQTARTNKPALASNSHQPAPPAQQSQEPIQRFKTPAPIQVVPAANIPIHQRKVMPSPLFSRSVSAPVVNQSMPEPAAVPRDDYDDTTQEIFIAPPPDRMHTNLSPVSESPQQRIPFALPYPVGRANGAASPTVRQQGIPPPRRPIQYNTGSPRSAERQYPHTPQDIIRPQPPVRIPSGGQGPYGYNHGQQDDRSNLPSARPQQHRNGYPRRGPGPNPNGLPYPRDSWVQQNRHDRPYYPQSYNPHGRPQQRPPQQRPAQQRPTQQYNDMPRTQAPSGHNTSQMYQADHPSPNSLLSKRRGPTMANDMMLTPTMTPTTQSLWQRESHRYPSV